MTADSEACCEKHKHLDDQQACLRAMRERLAGVHERMAEAVRKSGRASESVRLIAVSKFHPASDVRLAALCGQKSFGENYVQEALAKQADLTDLQLDWHCIGHVQTNKAKDVTGRFALVHGVDNTRLASSLAARLPENYPPQAVLIQVNIGDEPQKSGIEAGNLHELAEAILKQPRLRLLGLMGMPPIFDNPEAVRPMFARLRELRDALETRLGLPLPELSMGMSGDFEAAIEEGATLIRVGTTIFGPRPVKE